MAKTNRIKADAFVVADLARAESAMMELAALNRKLQGITDNLNEQVDQLKDAAKAECTPLEARKKTITDALCTFLKMNRAEVLAGRKSVELAFGVMGFHASTALCQMRGITAEMTLERLKNAGLHEGIRLKAELDKDVMRGWPDERLALVGLVRQKKDQFYVELKEEKLNTEAV